MLQRYTFLSHSFKVVLNNSRELINGLDKAIAVFYNEKKQCNVALVFDGELDFLAFENTELINDLRKSTQKTNWIKPSQLPFETKSSQIEQLSFADETESTVLEMRFKNPFDNKADVLYFFFKNNIGNFRLSNTNEAMAVTVKEVIQNLLYNQIAIQLKQHYEDKKIHQKLTQSNNSNQFIKELQDLKQTNFNQQKSIYTYLLNELSVEENTNFVLSNNAVDKLSGSGMTLSEIKSVLQKTLEVIINKYDLSGVYEISEYDIQLTSNNSIVETSISEQNLNKTALYLDRYEQAAKLLLSKNIKITGINIGDACEPPVSAAAISDILKKHKKKIITLFNQHPHKWSTVKKYFKPLKNIDYKQISNIYPQAKGA